MARLLILLLALAALAPAASAVPKDAFSCTLDAGVCQDLSKDGATAHADPLKTGAHARAAQPTPERAALDAEVGRYAHDEVGEQVVGVALRCHYDAEEAPCAPTDWFAGAHVAPEGHDARVGTNGQWRSLSGGYSTSVAGRDVGFMGGTFFFEGLRHGYLYVWAGDQQGGSTALPSPT